MDLLHKQKIGTAVTVLVVLGFNVVMLMLLELPLLGYATRPEWTEAAVKRFSDGLTRHGGRIGVIAGTAFGFVRSQTQSTMACTALHCSYNLTFLSAFLSQGGVIPKQW